MYFSMHLPPKIVDLTAKTPVGKRIRKRVPGRLDAAVLHQMAGSYGNVPENYITVDAHYVVMRDGRILHLHPAEYFVISSSAFNEDAVAIEFEGNFADDQGRWRHGDKVGKHTLTKEQIDGGRDLLGVLSVEHKIEFVFAHRQGEAPNLRANCPGPDIWYHIGEWAKQRMDLSDGGPGYCEGKGAPIPDSWRKPRA